MSVDLRGRSFLKLLDYTPSELHHLIDLAASLKAAKAGPNDRLTKLSDWRDTAIMTLAKKEEDRFVLGEQLNLFHKKNADA